MIKEVQRVLKVGGYYMIISYGAPDDRLIHLKRKFEKFKIEILKIEKDYVEEKGYDNYHYIYLCQKLEGADEVSKQFFDETIKELNLQQKMEEEQEEEQEDSEKIDKNEENLNKNDNKEKLKNIVVQNEKDGKKCNLDTSLKIDLKKIDKKENNLINGNNNKIISDKM